MEPRDPFDLCGVTIDGKYRVASVIGDGGFGVVYRGVHKGFGELIAIKCLKLPLELDEAARAELLEKLQDEGRLLHRLSKATSGIVQALDVGAFTTPAGIWVPYLVMEWLEGETLGEYLKRRNKSGEGGMELGDALKLLEPAARALAVAHAQKIAHRDVKPANIFLSEVGGRKTAKVLDFGIAKVLSDQRGYTTALENTAMAPTAFTPRYGAPEQFNKQRGATGPWTDVFALALVVVECVSGRKGLEGDDPTQLYIAAADPALRPTLRARGVDVPDAVEEVLRKALEVEPKKRYLDAGVFWASLEAAAQLAGSDTYPQGSVGVGRVSRPSGPASGPKSSNPKPSKPPGRALGEGSNPVDDHEPMLETGEYEARRQGKEPTHPPDKAPVSDAKSAFGPTLPVESMKSPRKGSKKTSAKDLMEETPQSARKLALGETTASESSKGSYIWAGLAIAVFVGGAAFIYSTLTSSPTPKKAPPSGSAVASASGKSPSPLPSASLSASAKLPVTSVTASVSPSAAPSALPSASATASVVASVSVAPSADPLNAEKTDMVKIKPATFTLGESGPEVSVSSFWLDRREVSVRRYQACINAGSCTAATAVQGADANENDPWNNRCNARGKGQQDHPINCLTYAQAEAFCKWEGKRLPTEAEWELSARGGRGHKFPWGDTEPNCDQACYDKNDTCRDPAREIGTCGVGFTLNDQTGDVVYDMGGNVSEWVSTAEGDKVAKGGNFFSPADDLVGTKRISFPAGYAHPTIGVRCAETGQ